MRKSVFMLRETWEISRRLGEIKSRTQEIRSGVDALEAERDLWKRKAQLEYEARREVEQEHQQRATRLKSQRDQAIRERDEARKERHEAREALRDLYLWRGPNPKAAAASFLADISGDSDA